MFKKKGKKCLVSVSSIYISRVSKLYLFVSQGMWLSYHISCQFISTLSVKEFYLPSVFKLVLAISFIDLTTPFGNIYEFLEQCCTLVNFLERFIV